MYNPSMHVEIHYHFIQENVLQGDIELKQINTKERWERKLVLTKSIKYQHNFIFIILESFNLINPSILSV